MALSPYEQVSKWHDQAGPIYKIDMGNQLYIMINDPYLAQDIFVKAGNTTSDRLKHYFLSDVHSMGSRGIVFSEYGPVWRFNRKSVANVLKPTSIEKFSKAIELDYERLIDCLLKETKEDEAFDPSDNIQLTTLNVVMLVMFAHRMENVRDPLFKTIKGLIDTTVFYSGPVGDIPSALPGLSWLESFLQLKKKMQAFSLYRSEVYQKMIDNARQTSTHNLIQEFYKIKEEEKQLTDNDIMVLVADTLGAGSETTANTLSWMLSILSQHFDVQEKLIQELDEWKAKNPTRKYPSFQEDRDSFPYALSVQKEVARISPPDPFGIPRACREDTEVNGYLIPKGAVLIPSMNSMHRQGSVYKNPNTFCAERFLGSPQTMHSLANGKIEQRDQFIFGFGRRICPGIYLSELEFFLFSAYIFSNFTIHPELDSNGKPIKVDPLIQDSKGLAGKPALTKFRFIRR
ncbi:cytochrome P450 [Sporodiniella umbellata]|nr:cytochrome P450 [Sporodiniella umbellata]